MNKYLLIGLAGAALVSAVGAVFIFGGRRAPKGEPDFEVIDRREPSDQRELNAQPAPPLLDTKGKFEIDEKMPFRKGTWTAFGNDREVEVSASARRRLTSNGPVYFLRIMFPVHAAYIPFGAGRDFKVMIEVHLDDAVAIADFLEKPLGALPEAATKGDKALLYRTFMVDGCFEHDSLLMEYDLEVNSFAPAYVTKNSEQREVYLDPKLIASTIRAAVKDIDTLKKHPAKR